MIVSYATTVTANKLPGEGGNKLSFIIYGSRAFECLICFGDWSSLLSLEYIAHC